MISSLRHRLQSKGFCRKSAFLRPTVKIVCRKINALRALTFLFSVICDRTLRGGWRGHAFLSSLSTYTIDHLACIRGVIYHIGQRLGRMVTKLTMPEKLSDSFISILRTVLVER